MLTLVLVTVSNGIAAGTPTKFPSGKVLPKSIKNYKQSYQMNKSTGIMICNNWVRT
jgi:hypothetical protein